MSVHLYHLPKKAMAPLPEWQAHLPAQAFYLETCMRYLVLSPVSLSHVICRYAMEAFEGGEAYRFLLETACGLHSEMPGEPEVFGQVKEAWRKYSEANPREAVALQPVMRNLFQDTKRIRAQHLQEVSGASYFTATEKLIGLKRQDSVLIVGAGQFGSLLAHHAVKRVSRVTVLNRSEKGLNRLQEKLGGCKGFSCGLIHSALEEEMGAHDHVLVAIPSLTGLKVDAVLRQAWLARKGHHGSLVHYCEYINEQSGWANISGVYLLNHVLSVQRTQSASRARALGMAQNACITQSHYRYPDTSDALTARYA